MRKFFIFCLVVFITISLLAWVLNPASLKAFRDMIYQSDLLFPFSIYESIGNPASHSDFTFTGYTPFAELLLGWLVWLVTRDIHVTIVVYGVIQALAVMLCLLFLARRVFGRSLKASAAVLAAAALPHLLFACGLLPSTWHLSSWYEHISTLCFGILAVAVLVHHLGCTGKHALPALLALAVLVMLAVMADILFVAQFIAPMAATILFAFIIKQVKFRQAAIAILTLLYATAGGLALYQIPRLLGFERVWILSAPFKLSAQTLAANTRQLFDILREAWGGFALGTLVWIVFYAACLVFIARTLLAGKPGRVRLRLALLLAFFIFQLVTTFGSSITTTPFIRYALPLVFVPLAWGWGFLLLAVPGWMRALNGKRLAAAGTALVVVALAVLLANHPGTAHLARLADTYPSKGLVDCLDQQAGALNLHRGMGNYWQARHVTLFSQQGLAMVSVNEDLTPFTLLTNSDHFREDFDFVVISNFTMPGTQVDRATTVKRFGQPAASFFCGESEVMVYNRPEDRAIRGFLRGFFPAE